MDSLNQEILEKIIIIANDIFNLVGPGYNENIYHRAFEVALRISGINYQSEVVSPVFYKGYNIGYGKIDLIVNNNLIIELKAIVNFNNDNVVQIKNYMNHYSINEGLIINFGQPNKNNNGELSIKYINASRIFNLINNVFIESGKDINLMLN